MDCYPREHVRKRGRPPKDWDKEMKMTCGGAAWKRLALERKEWKRMGQCRVNGCDIIRRCKATRERCVTNESHSLQKCISLNRERMSQDLKILHNTGKHAL
ncbi:unnamed protein product [Nezara viridula]|uniref:Uncharacterized protein n=1 Tax=Nezara viridula TaxID=85310 RepID=A0A9P0MSV3_NEZVI|nr:unnamed protein product [Nezara viridula]